MLDVTEQLRRYADTVAETVDPVPFTAADAVTTQPAREHRRRWPFLAAAAAVALVVLAGIGWLAVRAEENEPPPATDPAPTTRDLRPGVTMLDPGPLEPRADAAVVWTGQEMVVWGGDIEAFNLGLPGEDRSFADGAAYDPDTQQWRRMADSPLPDTMDGATAVSTDEGVVIARGRKVARWSPDTDEWRELGDAPADVFDLVATSPGGPVFSASANALLDPATGRWTLVTTPPVTLDRPVALWNGYEVVAVGGPSTTGARTSALTLDVDSRTWSQLPDPQLLTPLAIAGTRQGSRLVFTDYEMQALALERVPDGGSWEAVPPVPARFSESLPTITAVGDALVVTEPQAIAIRIGDRPWIPVPYDGLDFSGRPVTDGQAVFRFGMTDTGRMQFARIDPVRLANEARALQVGVARVALPERTTLGSSSYQNAGTTATVRVDLVTATGDCAVASSYIPETAPVRGWVATLDERTWTNNATTTDQVEITCDDAETARQLRDGTTFPSTSR